MPSKRLIEMTVASQRKVVEFSQPAGGGGGSYQVMIENYYYGQVVWLKDEECWHFYGNKGGKRDIEWRQMQDALKLLPLPEERYR